jgi:hypothetical protein
VLISDLLRGDLGRPIVYYPRLCPIYGGLNATILLAYLCFWADKGDDPDGWVWKKNEQVTAETGLSRREQDTARTKLTELALIELRRKGQPPVLWYRVDFAAVDAAWEAYCTKAPDALHDAAESIAQKRRVLTSTETTTHKKDKTRSETQVTRREAGAETWARRHGLID